MRYDEEAQREQNEAKRLCTELERFIETKMKNGRWKLAAFFLLEITYMAIGKALRDDQIARNGSAELQEERKNG